MKTKKLFKSVIATTGLCFLLSSCGSTAPVPAYQAVYEVFRPDSNQNNHTQAMACYKKALELSPNEVLIFKFIVLWIG